MFVVGDPTRPEGPYEDARWVGVPGPAGVRRLIGYATRLGVGTSASVARSTPSDPNRCFWSLRSAHATPPSPVTV